MNAGQDQAVDGHNARPGLIHGSTAREIAASAERAIREGAIKVGQPLPTVRDLAGTLGTSPATVYSAYRTLRERGVVIADGRRGTRVAPRPALRGPEPTQRVAGPAVRARRDLTIGLADPALLPPVPPVLAKLDFGPRVKVARLDAPDPQLAQRAREWFSGDGVADGEIAITSGAIDGIERVLQAHLRPGDRVVVEDPAYPPIKDLVLALGLVPVPVMIDSYGLIPDALEQALSKETHGMLIVPRAQNPFGAALDQQRAEALHRVVARRPELLIVEDDHAGAVSGVPFRSSIPPGWARWTVIRSVSKVLHPDLRLALIAGDATTIARVEGRQALGPRWVSHILQATVAEMLSDPEFGSKCDHAADVYSARRNGLIAALAEQGVEAYGRSGLNVWITVREEAPVVSALRDAGWEVYPGERFRSRTAPGIRITIATLRSGEAAEIAQVVGALERSRPPRHSY